jgi:hypothetical protein
MELTLAHFKEGKRMAARALSNKPFKKYEGDAEAICRKIIYDCWNGRYFQVSNGHFLSFYMRDFGFCAEPLMKLGFKHEVMQTLDWALYIWKKWDMLTTTITPDSKPIHVFDYAPDTLPLLIRTLRQSKTRYVALEYKEFLNQQIRYYYDYVMDKDLGLVDPKKKFSSMRDHYTRKSSMYDNSMMAMLSNEIENLRQMNIKLVNPFKKYNFKKTLLDRFWVGTHFLDDLTMDDHMATDANVFPFYCDIFQDQKMMWTCMTQIQKYKLDRPLPARYSIKPQKEKEQFPMNVLAPNYEGDTCWTMLGMIYLYMIKKINKHILMKYLEVYEEYIEHHGNFLELFDGKGEPYKTTLYKTDEGMIWAAMYLDLLYH